MSDSKIVYISLTDDQIEKIADRAVEKLDARIGKSVRTRAILILGLAASALVSLVAGALFLRG